MAQLPLNQKPGRNAQCQIHTRSTPSHFFSSSFANGGFHALVFDRDLRERFFFAGRSV
jgi:hypothetical protein